jgi:hypothetical protein
MLGKMKYDELITLYKNNEFRKIDEQSNCRKFYLLRSISKSNTLKKFCQITNTEKNLNELLENEKIKEEDIVNFIRNEFKPKTEEEINCIEAELNKMQNFDWGGSMGNNLEKNIVNNFVKKIMKYDEIEKAITGTIQKSVYGYTLNSWYNHWSTILIEEIFNSNRRILPTVDLVEKIDFFIDNVPFDLKVTYFPEELMKRSISDELNEKYGSKNELTCSKKIAKELNITIPSDLNDKALTICLNNLLKESIDDRAKKYVQDVAEIKKKVIEYYKQNPNELMVWLYENQGEMRFDAANRFYLVLVDSENIYDSWKLKRNVNLLKREIQSKLSKFDKNNLNNIQFHWLKDGKDYNCISELLFIVK